MLGVAFLTVVMLEGFGRAWDNLPRFTGCSEQNQLTLSRADDGGDARFFLPGMRNVMSTWQAVIGHGDE